MVRPKMVLRVLFAPLFLVSLLVVAPAIETSAQLRPAGCRQCGGRWNCRRCYRTNCQSCQSTCDCVAEGHAPLPAPAPSPAPQMGVAPSPTTPDSPAPAPAIPDADDLTAPNVDDFLAPSTSGDMAADIQDAVGDGAGDGLPGGFGIAGAALGAPNMIGDNFGNGFAHSTISQVFSVMARGDVIGTSMIAFEVGPDMLANDFLSTGPITTAGGIDSVAITEPMPPTDAPIPTAPGFTFVSGTATTASPFSGGAFWDVIYHYDAHVLIPAGGGGGGGGDFVVGRMKLAENASPLPQDRVFVNYSHFDNVPLQPGGVNVNRFVPGFEKTFCDGLMSIELRAPLAATLTTDYLIDGANETSDVAFGDLFLTYKALLFAQNNWAVSAGLSMTVPTAEDSTVSLSDGTPLVRFENTAVNLMPFVGGLITGDRWFGQGFLQVDVDVNGDRMLLNETGTGLAAAGRLQETTLFYADMGLGYWLRPHNPCCGRLAQGIASTLELHYNRSLEETDVIRTGRFQIGEPLHEIQILNAVAGVTFVVGKSNLSLGYAAPIGNGADQVFDGELRVLFNRFL